ncbi:MAG: ammonium transporter [Leptospirales bacterium]
MMLLKKKFLSGNLIKKPFQWVLALVVLLTATEIFGQDADVVKSSVSVEMFTINNTWMLIATILVFIMHLGFATLEAGLTRAKNTVNILFKNTFIVSIGIITYAAIGFNLMYPDVFSIEGIFGFDGFGIAEPAGEAIDYADGAYTYWTDFLFQGMFAATAATIISGAVAERIKLLPFFMVITVYVAVIYPIAGSWVWGGGFLTNPEINFHDFAGSTLVHSVGGWGALIGVLLLGPRLGKYGPNGHIKPIYGHNMPLATIGVFLLWFGWYGFNGGSVLSADPEAVSSVFVTTTLAAAAGVLAAGFMALAITGSLDLSMALNGALAGLVGITAGADVVSPMSAILIGLIAGILVVVSVLSLDKLKLDDPVGAISVHLVCGVWGTLAVGIFSAEFGFFTQLIGVAAYGAISLVGAGVLFYLAKLIFGIRVTREEEIKGLDISEHGMEAYSGFQIFTTND